MVRRIISLVGALLATVASFVCLGLAEIWYNVFLPRRDFSEPRLAIAVCLFGGTIYLMRCRRDLPAWILLIGSSAFLGYSLHDSFIDYGLTYRWFQFGGTDGWVFRGFFEPQENPILRGAYLTFQAISLLTYAGIFWLTARFMNDHLTRRWS